MICTDLIENGNYGIKWSNVEVPIETSEKNDKVMGSWKDCFKGDFND